MRRLSIAHTEWSNGWGGQEIRIVNEARGVAARGHRVLIVARPECRILERARAAGLPTAELPMRHAFDIRAVIGLRRIIRHEHIDIVNTHSSVDSWIGAFAAKLAGVKLVRTRHVSNPIRPHLFNFVHRLPDAVITTGGVVRRQFVEQTGLPAERVVSVPTGVDVEYFTPQPCVESAKASLGVPPEAQVVSNVAVLRRFKRHDVLVDAAARLRDRRDLHVVIAGEGSQRPAIEERIRNLDLTRRVHLLGHVDDIRPLVRCSDIVASSSGSHEGVPQSLVQALAMARPVVATDVGSVAEVIVNEQTGLLVPPDNPAALATAIERLLNDTALARSCGERGRSHVVAHYSHEQMIDRVLDLYAVLTA